MTYSDIFRHELNPAQLEAVNTLKGPLLILAGAGSGKTRALTYRFANLVIQGECAPHEILAVTFTNKAARNMESRVVDLLLKYQIPIRNRLWINTFHSSCVRILREHIHLLDYKDYFNIYDASDQLNMIKKVVAALELNEKLYPPKSIQYAINQAKLNAQTPEDLVQAAKNLHDEKVAEAFLRYEEEMKRANCLDFDDLLVKTVDLFRSYPDILELYQKRFLFIMVDEYQDTNRIQYNLIQMLGAAHKNVCVVGDEDQSIYSWRGADIRNILDFEKDFPDAKVIKLEENYRSSQTIVKATSTLIRYNTQRKDKECFTNNPTGDPIVVCEQESEYDEARFVAREIQSLMQVGDCSFKDFAVFYRTNAQSRVLEEQLRTLSLPYKIVGGIKFYERMEVKDVLAYLKLILNPTDDIALSRIINIPVRGIGKTTLAKIEEFAAKNQTPMISAISDTIDSKVFNSGTTRKLQNFLMTLKEIQVEARDAKPLGAYHTVLEKTRYLDYLKEYDSAEAPDRIANLEELDNAIDRFEKERGEDASLQSFLEEMALVSDADAMSDADSSVTLMTLHISKGLEFPYVFIVGLEENLFPSQQAVAALDPTDLEEERRLAYVGMTRAEKRLYLTHARERRVWGTAQRNPASRFIEELPPEYVENRGTARRPRFMDRMNAQRTYSTPSSTKSFTPRRDFDADEDFSFPSYEDMSQDTSTLNKGMRVKHPTFGVGTIYETEGRGEQQKVSVLFDSKLLKKFVVKFARLERV